MSVVGMYRIVEFQVLEPVGDVLFRLNIRAVALFDVYDRVPLDITTMSDPAPISMPIRRADDLQANIATRHRNQEAYDTLFHLFVSGDEVSQEMFEDLCRWLQTGIPPESDEDDDG